MITNGFRSFEDLLKEPFPQWTMETLEERVVELAAASVAWRMRAEARLRQLKAVTALALLGNLAIAAFAWWRTQ